MDAVKEAIRIIFHHQSATVSGETRKIVKGAIIITERMNGDRFKGNYNLKKVEEQW